MMDIIMAVLVLLIIIFCWIMLYDGNRFVVRRYTFSDARIRKKCRAVVLADLHNKTYGKDNEKLLAAIRAQEPDMILVAGDMLTARPGRSFEPAIHLLGELAKDYPIYYGNGNHEHRIKLYPDTYGDMAQRYAQALAEHKICPLVNEKVTLPEFGISIYGAEIDRDYYRRFRVWPMEETYLQELLGRADEDTYRILLAHNPDYFPQYVGWGADLVLAGHVHGGLVRIPILNRGVASPGVRLFPKYDGGKFEEGKSTMLLSRGLGVHTIPVRIFNPGEVLTVDLEPEKTGE